MLNSQKKSILKKITNYDKGGIFMTNPSPKKKRKTIKMQTENYKKEKEQILKQIELSDKIKEIEHRIQLELEQYNIVINKKKEELSHIEKRVKQINDKNESLNMAYEKIKKEMEDKYNNKNKLKENKNLNNDKNDIIKEEDPLVIKIKENENIIEDTRKTMENYQKEINKLENIIFDDENLNQINKIKFEIKNVKERLNTLEKEKKYLLIVSEEHNKCIEAQDKIKKEIEYYNTELNKLKIEKNQNYKEKKEKYKNDMFNINKNTKKINDALLAPHEVEKIKEKKIKSTLYKFWVINKQNLLKYSLSDNNINMNTIPIKNKKEKIMNTELSNYNRNVIKLTKHQLYSKKKNYAENLNNLNLNIDGDLSLNPLFNSQTKNILAKILPMSEIEKYEKRYECADLEKKKLLREFSLENQKILREQKNMKNKMEKNNQKLKLNEAKNDKLNNELEIKENEYEKLRNNFINMKKELEDKKQKIKIWNEENILMKQKYQGIKDKYIENTEKEKEKDNDDEEGEEDEDEND